MIGGRIPHPRLGIGLHTGDAATGNIGSAERKQYSITGNVVILALRIEQLTKQYGAQILSEEVWKRLDSGKEVAIALGNAGVKEERRRCRCTACLREACYGHGCEQVGCDLYEARRLLEHAA